MLKHPWLYMPNDYDARHDSEDDEEDGESKADQTPCKTDDGKTDFTPIKSHETPSKTITTHNEDEDDDDTDEWVTLSSGEDTDGEGSNSSDFELLNHPSPEQ